MGTERVGALPNIAGREHENFSRVWVEDEASEPTYIYAVRTYCRLSTK